MLPRGRQACCGLMIIMRRRRASWSTASPYQQFATTCTSPGRGTLAALSPSALDSHVSDAVAAYLASTPSERLVVAATLASHPDVAALLMRTVAASPHAVTLLHDLRAVCGVTDARIWGPTLDKKIVSILRVVYGPAFTRTEQLTLASGAPNYVRVLVDRAQHSETVHAAPAADARRKYGTQRMVHAMFHVNAPEELLAVLYTSVLRGMPDSMVQIDAESGGEPNPTTGYWPIEASTGLRDGVGSLTTAAFYSVSAPHPATRGLRLGTRIIYQVASDIARSLPELSTFCTLSPVPGFVDWIRAEAAAGRLAGAISDENAAAISAAFAALQVKVESHGDAAIASRALVLILASPAWFSVPSARASLQQPLMQLARTYLLQSRLSPGDDRSGGQPLCPVAHFHLGNGARMARLCWAADTSATGLARSASVMVNYVYSTSGAEGLNDTMRARAAAYAARPGLVLSEQNPTVVGC